MSGGAWRWDAGVFSARHSPAHHAHQGMIKPRASRPRPFFLSLVFPALPCSRLIARWCAVADKDEARGPFFRKAIASHGHDPAERGARDLKTRALPLAEFIDRRAGLVLLPR